MRVGPYNIHFDRLTSTNDYAFKLLKFCNPPDGTIISTDYQFKGKGQRNSSWVSESSKNITLSIITYPLDITHADLYNLNKAICLGVAQCVQLFINHYPVYIKWPNDVYVKNRKICGILIQNSLLGKSIQNSVIGIGLNVNQVNFAEDLNATSLRLMRKDTLKLKDVIKQLLTSVEQSLQALENDHSKRIDYEYHERLLGFNQIREFRNLTTGESFLGKIIAVDQQGKLHVDQDNGTQIYQVKEIELLT